MYELSLSHGHGISVLIYLDICSKIETGDVDALDDELASLGYSKTGSVVCTANGDLAMTAAMLLMNSNDDIEDFMLSNSLI
jgi:hypothetical protein